MLNGGSPCPTEKCLCLAGASGESCPLPVRCLHRCFSTILRASFLCGGGRWRTLGGNSPGSCSGPDWPDSYQLAHCLDQLVESSWGCTNASLIVSGSVKGTAPRQVPNYATLESHHSSKMLLVLLRLKKKCTCVPVQEKELNKILYEYSGHVQIL